MNRVSPARYPGSALVTGASSGIGEAFARRLARDGFPLVVVARSRERLGALAAELAAAHGVRVDVVAADLSTHDGPSVVKEGTDALGLDISVLINNAGFGDVGDLVGSDRDKLLSMVDLNCRAVLDLSLLYAPGMVERGNGAVVVTSSLTAYQATPFMAAYAGTKAFDLLFAESLWAELRPHGVDVLALSPGRTATGFDAAAEMPETDSAMAAADVVEAALRSLGRRPSVVVGWANKALAATSRFVTRRVGASLAYRMVKGLARTAA